MYTILYSMYRKDNLFKLISFFIFFNLPKVSFAQQMGLDDKINEAFTPIANWWGGIVLHSFPGTSIPTIIFLLVGGALFFTLYFNFVNIRRIPLAIRTVTGRYDALDHLNTREFGNDLNKKKHLQDKVEQGEVSHFQALATAVSGTVGNGNIAGVALAIAVGGPGATFWMILCGLLGMSTKFVECTLGVKYEILIRQVLFMGGQCITCLKDLKNVALLKLEKFLQ